MRRTLRRIYGHNATVLGILTGPVVCPVSPCQPHDSARRSSKGTGCRPVLARCVLLAVISVISFVGADERAFASRLAIDGDRLLYIADEGESNVINISDDVGTYVVRDTGATIRVAAPCKLTEASGNVPAHASCPASGVASLGVNAGDADDAVSIESDAPAAVVVGGSGNDRRVGGDRPDRIEGGEGADTLTGRGGNDVLAGGDGADQLRGGPGNDAVAGGADDDSIQTDAGADSIDGGPGFDAVSYADRFAPVVVTLDGVANDGQQGETDNVQPTSERIRGGGADDVISGQRAVASSYPGVMLEGEAGNDVLVGGLGDDDIKGGSGNDQMSGGPGPDVLIGGIGADVIAGDKGDDLVDGADGAFDIIDCGAGTDSASLDPIDGGAQGCEVDVPGGIPSGVSSSSVAGFYEFSRERVRPQRGRRRVVAFDTDIPGDNRRRKQRVWIRVTFFTAGGRQVALAQVAR